MSHNKKPIRVFYSQLSGKFWATQAYKPRPGMPGHFEITGEKYDVTQDIAYAIVENELEFHEVEPEEASTKPIAKA